jgi:archaellum component FlaC
MKIYELVGNYNQVWDMINSGEVDLQTIQDTLESIEAAIEVKCENSVYLIKNLEAYTVGLETEIKRLQAKYEAVNNKTNSIKEYLFKQLESANKCEVKAGLFNIKQQMNPPAVSILDENKIPRKYKIKVPASYKISKTAIAADLKVNIKVRGATLQNSTRWVIK